jgi:hypothetical protein
MADIKYLISVDAQGAVTSIKDFEGVLDKTGKAAATASPHVKTFGDVIDNSGKVGNAATAKLAGLWKQIVSGELVVQAINKAWTAFKDLIGDSIKGAIESEKAEKNLKAALEITGRTVEGNLKHYLDFAKAKMRVTLYTDEEIQGAQALLVQLTSLNQNGIDRATKGAMGLASTLGIDLHSATMKVVLGMKGQEIGLARVGIRIAENLTAEEKQASLLDQLEKLYQRSTKEVDTFGGSLKQTDISLGELKDTIGKAVTESDTLKKSIGALKGAIDDLNTVASQEGKNWVDYLAEKAKYIPIVQVVTKNIEWMTEKLHEEAEGVRYNESVYNGLKIALDTYDKVLMNAGIDVEKITGGFIKHKKAVNETGAGVHELTAEEIALAKAAQAILDKYSPLQATIRKLIDEEKALTKAKELGLITDTKYRIGMEAIEKEMRSLGTTTITNTLLPAVRNITPVIKTTVDTVLPEVRRLGMVWWQAIDKMADGPEFITKSFRKEAPKWVAAVQDVLNHEVYAFSVAINQIDATLQQGTNNKTLALDKEYQARLDYIKKSVMSEEEKNKAVEGLDAEYNMKRRKVQREAAEQGRLIAIANAIINVAEGMTKALAQGGIFGPALAAIVFAFGAIQVALIKAQPIPLAAGAIFKKPAMLSSAGGNTYEVAEAGEAEIVSSPRRLREAIMGSDRGYRTERPSVIQVRIFLDSREMKNFTVKTVQEAGHHGFLGVVGKAM